MYKLITELSLDDWKNLKQGDLVLYKNENRYGRVENVIASVYLTREENDGYYVDLLRGKYRLYLRAIPK